MIGLTLGLLLTEAALQLAAAWVRASGTTLPALIAGRPRVVCLGDSNTYGLYVPRAQAWPQQLEDEWRREPGRPPIQVINLGYPGMNSSRVRNQLPSVLETLHPDVVMVMVGANNLWTEPEPPRDAPPTFGMLAWRYSRVYRLVYMLTHSGTTATLSYSGGADPADWRRPEDTAPFEQMKEGRAVARVGDLELPLGWQMVKKGSVQDLQADLAAIAALAREAGATLVFLTYPANSTVYGGTNRQLRAAAERTGTPLVDLGKRFDAMCPWPCLDLFFADHHPNALGHTHVAQELAKELTRRPEWLAR